MVNGFKPATLDEALSLLRDTGAVPYAGGTDLMVENRPGHPQCRNLWGKYRKRLRQGGHRAH